MQTFGHIISSLLIMAVCCSTAVVALKCWRCSTDVSNGDFCNDPFVSEDISEQQHYWSNVNCSYSAGVKSVNARPVCKKLVQEVYGKRVVARSCFYEDLDDPADKCARDTTSSYIKTIYCQTCNTDGCNGVTGIAPFASLLLLAVVGVKLCQ